MARASSTPKGAIAPAGSPANREIDALADRARDGRFLKQFEALVAFGYKPDPADTVQDIILTHFLRDLAPVTRNPASHKAVPTAAGGEGRKARRAVNLDLILRTHTYASALKHLARATPAEIADLEARLSDALDMQEAKREAAAQAVAAASWRFRLAKSLRLASRMIRISATPAQRRRLAGLDQLHRDAVRDHAAASSHAAALRLLDRRSLGLPMPRDRKANRSRHRVAKAHRRYRRWWDTVPAAKHASDSRKRSNAPRWRDLTPAALVYAHTAAGYTFGRVSAFTLNLTADVDAKARTKPNPAAWLRDLIARRLEQELGRPVEVLVSLELNSVGALHVHGIIAGLSVGDEGGMKSALTLAGDHSFRGPQVRLAPSPDSGWASYCAKDFLKPFKHPHRFAATRGLAAAAREVFAGMVAFVSSHTGSNAESNSALTSNIPAQDVVNFLEKVPCVPILDRVALRCGQQMEAEECSESKSPLTDSQKSSTNWKIDRAPTLDTS